MYLFFKKDSLKIMGLSADSKSMDLPSIIVRDTLKQIKGLSLKKVDGKIVLEENQSLEEIIEESKTVEEEYKGKKPEIISLMEQAGKNKLKTAGIQRALFYLLRNLNNKKK